MRRPRKTDANRPRRRSQSARQSVQYGGEIAAASILQNFFIGRSTTTAFSHEARQEKECTFAEKLRGFATSNAEWNVNSFTR
jgi:hypothetical protein